MNSTALERFVEDFANGVTQQTDAIQAGHRREIDKFAQQYIGAFEHLCRYGDSGREALLRLFDHPRADVRVMAAAFLLRFRTQDALLVLEQEASKTGFAAFSAEQAIQRWKEGDWNLDLG